MTGSDFATAVIYSWPIFATIFALALFGMWLVQRIARAERARTRDQLTVDSLDFLHDPEAQREASRSYRRRFGDSPANQAAPAPWFDNTGGAA